MFLRWRQPICRFQGGHAWLRSAGDGVFINPDVK